VAHNLVVRLSANPPEPSHWGNAGTRNGQARTGKFAKGDVDAALTRFFDHDDSRQAAEGLVTPIRGCGLAGGQVARRMKKISYKGYRFPPEIIQQANLALRPVYPELSRRRFTGWTVGAG
jgi:hypothetical protein